MEFLSKSGLSFFKSLLDLYFATKSYVNKAISTNTGKFWGTFNDLADLQEVTGSNGDYAYVIVPDDYSTSYDRYKWQDGQWVYEYTVGGEAFDDDQWAAINSGITSADKTRLNEISENIGNNSISEMRSDIDANASEIEEINEELGDIDAALATKANVDGYYESMAVGQADNLKGQVLIPNDAAFRTSGGSEDVDTGLAHLNNVKGNTVSWNQLCNPVSSISIYGLNYTFSDGILSIQGVVTGNGGRTTSLTNTNFSFVSGHIYAFIHPTQSGLNWFIQNSRDRTDYDFANNYIFTASKTFASAYIGANVPPIGTEVDVSGRFLLFDLTLIYGAGNEPTTVEQFETDYEKWFGKPLTYEPYNAGELIPAKTTALKTTGFNQWDEEWEVGGISNQTGENTERLDAIRAKGFIKVLPNTNYYFAIIGGGSPNYHLQFYDSDKNFLFSKANFGNNIFNTSVASFVRFYAYMPNPKYNNNVCIHLVWSGTRNVEYEPYESHTLQLPLTTLTGKLNGAGESVVVFPDGMKKAGSVQDEIYISGGKTYAVKRVGSVDFGNLNWSRYLFGSVYSFYVQITNAKYTAYGFTSIQGKYEQRHVNIAASVLYNKELSTNTNQNYVYVRDDSYTDAATFKAAMSGVMLYYELAEPLIYELDNFTLPQTFRVNDWGTEEQVHPDGVSSVPATLANVYAMNAVDTINHLREEVTEIEGDITEMQSDIDANTSEIESHATQLQVEAEGLTQAHYELSAFEQIAQGKDEAVLPTLKAQTIDADELISYGAPRVLISDVGGAPSAANIPTNWDESTMDVWAGYPRFIGQQYIDKTNKKLYVALALTGSVNDWVLMN